MTVKFKLTFFNSNKRAVANNAYYPNEKIINDTASLKEACQYDFVCAKYKENHRSKANFIFSDCLAMDCDNDHSDNPEDWKTPEDIKKIFPDVTFAVQYSRHHNKPKENKSARPRFHVFFQIYRNEDWKDYTAIKKRVHRMFPWFDDGALDAARFFFGTEDPQVEIFEGKLLLDDLFLELDFPDNQDFSEIPEGQRYVTLRDYAAKILTRFGPDEKTKNMFFRKAADCNPPMEDDELQTIWHNGLNYYDNVISKSEGYIPPEVYNAEASYKPVRFTDKAQAEKLLETFPQSVTYTDGTKFMVWKDNYWKENQHAPKMLVFRLSDYECLDAIGRQKRAIEAMSPESQVLVKTKSPTVARNRMEGDQIDLYNEYKLACEYEKKAEAVQNNSKAKDILEALIPMIDLDVKLFDQNPFLLNTPAATYDLRKGLDGSRKHDPKDRITKITTVSPSNMGKEIWEKFLNDVFESDQDLILYAQEVCGMAALGKVADQQLIMAYGDGRNGKSTFWNTIHKVLGDYSGQVSPETLTFHAKHNVKAEMAMLRGKRFVIAAELGSEQVLNDSMLKQLCSNDSIIADRKFRDAIEFYPEHTVVLYTNNLPKVNNTDDGTWRRLTVMPFSHQFKGKNDIKNYGDYLIENAAPAVMAWIIEGAKIYIDNEFNLDVPACVTKATKQYKGNNDWLEHFINECCLVGPDYIEKSIDVYDAYRNFMERSNVKAKPDRTFWQLFEKPQYQFYGVTKQKEKFEGRYVNVCHGLKLNSEWKEGDNFDFVSDETESPKPVETEPDYGF